MSDTLESLKRRKQSAAELASVVRAMKAMAASNISQYEMAVQSLKDYYRTISLGMYACFANEGLLIFPSNEIKKNKSLTVAIFFGSDQGLVGRFNDILTRFAIQILKNITGEKVIWAVGERMNLELKEAEMVPVKVFNVPNSVTAITPLVNDILIKSEELRERNPEYRLTIFYNSPATGEGYQQENQQLLPLDKSWEQEIKKMKWPSKKLPQVIGGAKSTLRVLIREYLFVSIYKACAESLASENASRLEAMQRAEKNIGEISEDLNQSYNQLRQSTIDEELFDIVAGFEALKKEILKK